ncbi:MAG: response regulator transcription factor [Flavobacterium sp.]|nr:response regulator transcription factor [Flavobacterium sp.]
MQFSYLIIDRSSDTALLKEKLGIFESFVEAGHAETPEEGLNKILELRPQLVFLSVEESDVNPFAIVSEIGEYLNDLPTFIAVSTTTTLSYEAFQRGVSGYLLKPIDINLLRKCLFRYQKKQPPSPSKKISIKSQGDYHFISAEKIVYLKADNNTTDFYLENGKVITAYKTLKFYENLLPDNFFRIHHSYVINCDYVSRINLGRSDCYLSNNKIILPFSRTYKCNIDKIIGKIAQ